MGYAGLELDGQVAVVIGGTSGIGQVIACGLAEAGADVIPTSRRAEQVESTARRIEALGRRSLRVTSDVTDRASLQGLLDAAVKAFGKVDIMVNAAGRTKRTPILETDEREWNEILETNLTGALRAGQIFGRHMVDHRYGRIIHIASLGSYLALYEVAAYSASKAGLASLTKTMAVEWAGRGCSIYPEVRPEDRRPRRSEEIGGRRDTARKPRSAFPGSALPKGRYLLRKFFVTSIPHARAPARGSVRKKSPTPTCQVCTDLRMPAD